MKKETFFHNRGKLEDSYDESGDYSGPDLSEPKRSPMRRKEKFKTKDFQAEKKHKDRRRGYRNKIQYDFGLWEE
ncbi:MAG: hypothetical protein PVG96_02915 [Desulfobacterales bacterium]|jgi:hypothetical protein